MARSTNRIPYCLFSPPPTQVEAKPADVVRGVSNVYRPRAGWPVAELARVWLLPTHPESGDFGSSGRVSILAVGWGCVQGPLAGFGREAGQRRRLWPCKKCRKGGTRRRGVPPFPCSLASERRFCRSDAQYKPHREALMVAADPVTAIHKRNASTQEGGLCRDPASTTQTVKLPLGPLFLRLRAWFLSFVIPVAEFARIRGRQAAIPAIVADGI
jgi:hypothetical protein